MVNRHVSSRVYPLSPKMTIILVALSIASVVGITIDLQLPAETEVEAISDGANGLVAVVCQVLSSLETRDQSILLILAAGALFFLFRHCAASNFSKKRVLTTACLALIFSACMTIGESFDISGDSAMLWCKGSQIIKSVWMMAAWAIVAFAGFSFLFDKVSRAVQSVGKSETEFLLRHRLIAVAINEKPWIPFVLLAICWLPWLVGCAPGLFMGDSPAEIREWFNLPNWVADRVNLVDPDVLFTTHHPVAHVALLGSCVWLGQTIFGSDNAGVMLYTCFQYLMCCGGFAYAIHGMKRVGVCAQARFAVLTFVLFMPWFPNYAVLVTKDSLFSVFMLLAIVQTAIIGKLKANARKSDWVLLFVWCILLSLFRSAAIVFSLGVVLALLLINKTDLKKCMVLTGCLVVLYGAFSYVLVPAMGISPASKAEMLSIPFQQTARYVSLYPDEVTNEEKAAIDTVLIYENLTDRYDPRMSDAVKNYFNKDASSEDLNKYFAAWMQMGLKHPGCYISATCANYYGYFYFSSNDIGGTYLHKSSEKRMQNDSKDGYFDFHHPDWVVSDACAGLAQSYFAFFFKTPVLSLLFTSAFWVWLLILLVAFSVGIHRRDVAALAIPLVLVCCVFLIGPCNGANYYRYVYPLVVVLPFLLTLLFGSTVPLRNSNIQHSANPGHHSAPDNDSRNLFEQNQK